MRTLREARHGGRDRGRVMKLIRLHDAAETAVSALMDEIDDEIVNQGGDPEDIEDLHDAVHHAMSDLADTVEFLQQGS